MSDFDWNAEHACRLCMTLPGAEIIQTGAQIRGDSFAILFRAHREVTQFHFGVRRQDLRWRCILDTAMPNENPRSFEHLGIFPLQARSVTVLQA